MKSISILVLTAALVGCSLQPPAVPEPNSQPVDASDTLGAFVFRTVSQATMPEFGDGPGGAPAETVVGAVSGNMDAYYSWGYPSAKQDAEQRTLVSMTRAEGPGSKGSLREVLDGIVAPVIQAWASDAKLVRSEGRVDSQGGPLGAALRSPNPFSNEVPGWPSWRLLYTSESRHEVLEFFVGPDRTLAIRMRWAPLTLPTEAIKVDGNDAVKRLVAAIRDPNARSVEEQTGRDYFLDVPFVTKAVPPALPGRNELMLELPADAAWVVSLHAIFGKLVWQLNYHAPMASPQPWAGGEQPPRPPFSFLNGNSIHGMVDAETGAVIRFNRLVKHYFE